MKHSKRIEADTARTPTSDLDRQYRAIGISAVAAALRFYSDKPEDEARPTERKDAKAAA